MTRFLFLQLLIFFPLLFLGGDGFSQNNSYKFLEQNVYPFIDKGDYERAKENWIHYKHKSSIDPQESFLFAIEALQENDTSFFKQIISGLIKERGFHITINDTLACCRNNVTDLFIEKSIIDWLFDEVGKLYPLWLQDHHSILFVEKKVDQLFQNDQIFLEFRPSKYFQNCPSEVDSAYWKTVAELDLRHISELASLCKSINSIPNHFDHGLGIYYKLGYIVWHNLKIPSNRDFAWKILLPWIDKGYFEGKIGTDLYESYDYWLNQHTGFQFYGFIENVPIKDSVEFGRRLKKYGFF